MKRGYQYCPLCGQVQGGYSDFGLLLNDPCSQWTINECAAASWRDVTNDAPRKVLEAVALMEMGVKV